MRQTFALLLFASIGLPLAVAAAPVKPAPAPPVDWHQHLLTKEMAEPGQKPIDAKALTAMLDAAGIKRAVVLSNAFRFGSPDAPPIPDEYARVIAENDWTAREVAKYPQRLVAFCSFNPLKEYALGELARCARDKRFGRGIKLQFGNSGVNLDDPTDIALLRRVFRAANTNGMTLVVHMRTQRPNPYGAAQALSFLDEVLPAAPDVPVQIAHLAGGGGYGDAAMDGALDVFQAAIGRQDPRVKNLWFDIALIAGNETQAPRIAQRLRALGLGRILYGSDGGDPTDPPAREMLAIWRKLPLNPAEFRAIESNARR
ncbi:MAG: amidohydrolase family protein [Steroidobacteraceae bacterium]|nr:amidohydrolase family protein [Steroidobacteraceae bacterium]